MQREPIIALDFPGQKETMEFLDRWQWGEGENRPFVKIGMELFYGTGPDLVKTIRKKGYRIFLDLKLHDIPTTVRKAMRNLATLGVDMVNVHAGGGKAMMEAAREGLSQGQALAPGDSKSLLIAVTQLTSTDQRTMNRELGIGGTLEEVVCSPLEAPMIHRICGPDFLTVTPGIRFAGDDANDQKRITTPEKARALGADFIVVGRAITEARDPLEAYRRCAVEFTGREEGKETKNHE